jgi:uncharacterized protein YbjT (DUF2867 family)
MSSNPILVIGATGKTGRRVTASLQGLEKSVRAVSRQSPLQFDWNDPATWGAALENVRTAYVVHAGLGAPGASDQVRDFAQTAVAAGVERAVLLTTPDDGSAFSLEMRAAEKHVIASGLSLTSLRLRWFNQNFSEDFLLQPVLSGQLRAPAGAGREAFVDADDIAEVAVAALTDDRHAGCFYEVTGPRLLGFADIADEITRGAGHPLAYVPLEPDAFVEEQIRQGTPADWAYTLSAIYQDIGSHKLETVSGDVQAVLGKPARDFSEFVSKTASSGVWSGANGRSG